MHRNSRVESSYVGGAISNVPKPIFQTLQELSGLITCVQRGDLAGCQSFIRHVPGRAKGSCREAAAE